MAIWQFNRGEWTEAYVFLKLLGDGRIYGANPELNKDENVYIDIIEIIRCESDNILHFKRELENGGYVVKASEEPDNEVYTIVTAPELSERAEYLYNAIKHVVAGNRRLSIPVIQDYLEKLRLRTPKAALTPEFATRYGKKTDIVINMQDSVDHAVSSHGFSIKSHIGSNPTLFNASDGSNLVFEVKGCTEKLMHRINAKDRFLDMIEEIKNTPEVSLVYYRCKNSVFRENLELIDTNMDNILQAVLLLQCSYLPGLRTSNMSDIADALSKINPIGCSRPDIFYSVKIKEFLFDSFSGLTAAFLWNGNRSLTGGYIDVGKDGEMLYYRAVSDQVFTNYLFNNTFLDRPDRGVHQSIACARGKAYLENRALTEEELNSILYTEDGKKRSQKCNFGYIYEDDGRFFINLNFQVRFK